MAVKDVLHSLEWQVKHLFLHDNTGRFIMLPLESGKWKTSHLIIPRASSTNKNTGNGNCDSVKQILFGQRVLESYKWKLEDS
jgi:hypothetical protein